MAKQSLFITPKSVSVLGSQVVAVLEKPVKEYGFNWMKLGDYLYGVGTEKDGLVSLRVANIQEDTITLYEHHNGLISQPVNHLTANRAFYPEGYLEPNL